MKVILEPFEAARVSLRLLTYVDLPLTMAWRNKARCRSAFRDDRALTRTGHLAWFRAYLDRENDHVFVIEEKTSRKPIGQISLYRIDRDAGEAELGRLMIGEEWALRKGYATEAALLVVGAAWGAFNLRRLRLEVKGENAAALALYRKAGFVECARTEGWVTMTLERGVS
jgi:RimJ/RimL family protein N-acetyltransferase